ncbi:2Fe-2S iron-sulfur cluster-binding protein [Amycolatopsis sp. NPDC102389]|uniref:2Fe-2S iron-sulfur cluster-binding protein n=1 Tax=Amycolatopsis sp. NPDC102389 TaxID=3363941 RepID=UPI0037F946F4
MTTATGHHITVEGSGVRFPCAEGDTLVRAALRAGVGLSYECNSGSCGSCRYELLEGEVHDRRPDAPGLSARDRRKGRRLACQSEPLSDCVLKVAEPGPVPTPRPIRQNAVLREVRPLTHDMAEFVFDAEKHAAFSAGQYAMIHLPDGDVERAYSMSNLSNCAREWRFVVKRTPGGKATSFLFDRLRPGDSVVLDGPFGHAYLRPDDAARQVVCVGGGSGLGAMISVLLGIAALPDAGGWTAHLFCAGKEARDIHVPAAVGRLRDRLGRFHLHTALSAAGNDPSAGESVFRGFAHEAVLDLLGDSVTDHTYYAAGPPAMTDALARALVLEKGLPADRLYFDRFC